VNTLKLSSQGEFAETIIRNDETRGSLYKLEKDAE